MHRVFEVRHAASQLAFLCNQLYSDEHRDLAKRSVTDLSVDMMSDERLDMGAAEIHKEQVSIVEVHCKQMETKIVMVIVISNGRVIVYEEMRGTS
jgi:hypothetical protein